MAQQKFNNAFREALWETYGKKCFHCARELLLIEMRVDHVVPEHLLHGDAEKRFAALIEIGLPPDFDIRGKGNLVPSCERCNSQKTGSVLIGRSVAVALTRIGRSLTELEKNLSEMRKARELEDVLLAVSRSLDKGKFTKEEFLLQLEKVMQSYPDYPEHPGASGHPLNASLAILPDVMRSIMKYIYYLDIGVRKLARFRRSKAAKAMIDGLTTGAVTAEKVSALSDRYVVRGLNRVMGLDDFDIVFDVRGECVTVVSDRHD